MDYTYNRKSAADDNTDDGVDVEQTKKLPYGLIAATGVAVLLISAFLILLLVRKKKDR